MAVITDRYALYHGDCVELMRTLPDEKVHLSVYSPPFGGLYHYSEDAAMAGVASADYVLMFRKPGENKIPIAHPTGFHSYAGESQVPAELHGYRGWVGDQKQNRFSHWVWRQYASSVWDDIRLTRVLPFRDSKDPDDEKHVHPLQLDVIERVIALRSNPGETVFTPFMGVGSEVFGAVEAGRRGMGVELKASYFRQAVKNLELAGVAEVDAPNTSQGSMFEGRTAT